MALIESAGFRALLVPLGRAAAKTAELGPDVVLIESTDLEPPARALLRRLKSDVRTSGIPVVVLFGQATGNDRVAALELGAEDVLARPFEPRELTLRLGIVSRRNPQQRKLSGGAIEVDRHAFTVRVRGREVGLSLRELSLLITLMEGQGNVCQRDHLLEQVWGYAPGTESRTVDTHVKTLRKKLGKAGDYIETVRSVGYRFAT
jgi:DNA-binding response OmpR family regulator